MTFFDGVFEGCDDEFFPPLLIYDLHEMFFALHEATAKILQGFISNWPFTLCLPHNLTLRWLTSTTTATARLMHARLPSSPLPVVNYSSDGSKYPNLGFLESRVKIIDGFVYNLS